MMSKANTSANDILIRANEIGQSIWLDFIDRDFLHSGELNKLISLGLSGVTSNPTIFHSAIEGGVGYDSDIELFSKQGKSAIEIYEMLVVQDIAKAADILRPIYDSTDGADGFVSIEVNPQLSDDTAATINEAKRLFARINKSNVLIKVPATAAGIPAIRALIGEGINVNVTLIFSRYVYREVALAYLDGLQDYFDANNSDLSKIASVASFFVSRVDTSVDSQLPEGSLARGKCGVANARVAHADFLDIFSSDKYKSLALSGAKFQRQLWGSTSVKNPAYPDLLYLNELMGPDTINTVPPDTLDAFLDHGNPSPRLVPGIDQAHEDMKKLTEAGIEIGEVTDELLSAGLKAFNNSFKALIESIETKRKYLVSV